VKLIPFHILVIYNNIQYTITIDMASPCFGLPKWSVQSRLRIISLDLLGSVGSRIEKDHIGVSTWVRVLLETLFVFVFINRYGYSDS
jgi:hypothetical protein